MFRAYLSMMNSAMGKCGAIVILAAAGIKQTCRSGCEFTKKQNNKRGSGVGAETCSKPNCKDSKFGGEIHAQCRECGLLELE